MEKFLEDKNSRIKNSCAEAGVLTECGHLYPVRFFCSDKTIEPMHIAPWENEELDPTIPPMLKYLSCDFFCAPFGDSDMLQDESRAHGTSANDKWDVIHSTESSIKLKLSKKISGAELLKEIIISDGEPVIYQRHSFKSGQGKIPVGHHSMLKIPDSCYISFSDYKFGGTPPQPIETKSDLGRSILKYPQHFSDLTSIRRSDNKLIDASVYPFDTGHEDLFMIISDRNNPFGWSAVSCPAGGWLWFAIKNINILPNTVVWLSNGGRYYPPFSSRHKNVIGVEETNSFFHLGHKASIENNYLNDQGFKTFIDLSADKETVIPYLFGAVKIPGNFGKVKSITEIKDGIEITDNNLNRVHVKVNLKFIKDTL